ncbi:hypothetical protein [Cryobacterium lactosi]|uniref:hypothetical protein n=1 Tax=Cryobacterium lactosi TaxID=1259202 RepID=UPI00141A90B0|nr:hypothetical protein [Cryobacterium lactosi]
MTNRAFWLVAALLTAALAIVLFTSDLDFWVDGIIFVVYGASMGVAYKSLGARD